MAGSGKVKVLVVDDDAMIVELVSLILEPEAGVSLTRGGGDARALMDERTWRDVDVALVDLLLPGTTGDQLLDWLAQHAPHVRRIAMSAAGRIRLEQVQNADVRLLKPFMMDELIDAVADQKELVGSL
jgi:DNA-binding NtrC family response regulator